MRTIAKKNTIKKRTLSTESCSLIAVAVLYKPLAWVISRINELLSFIQDEDRLHASSQASL